MFLDQPVHEQEVAWSVLFLAEHGGGHGAGGVIHGQQQGKPGLFFPKPAVVAAVNLHQHSLLGHSLPAHPVLLRTAAARAADAGLDQDATHGGATQIYALQFSKQLGQVRVIGSRVLGAGQPHYCGSLGCQDGIVRLASPVSMGQGGRSVPSVSIQESPRMALAYPENLGGLTDGDLVFQDVVEHVESR